MQNQYFEYKLPKLSKDKANKKWFVRYAIRYPDEKDFKYHKEYGRQFTGESLNLIEIHKEREKKFKDLIALITDDLKNGRDRKNPELIKEIIQKEIAEKAKFSFDACFNMYLIDKQYLNPIGKKEKSAVTMNMFLRNQLKPFLEKNNLHHDLRDVTKKHLLEYLDSNTNWSNNTYNTKISFLGSFFQHLEYKDIITVNPVKKLKYKDKTSSTRFGKFTMEERDIYFKYLEENHYPLLTVTKVVYYAFIRFSELARLKVKDFDLEKMKIRIDANNSKTGKDKDKYVEIRKPLAEAIKEYLNRYEYRPDWFMFGRGIMPSPYKLSHNWHDVYRVVIKHLNKEYPQLFNRSNLVPYAWKHSGVTDLIQNNIKAKSTTELLQYVMRQCRHTDFKTTQTYWLDLGFDLDTYTDIIEL